MNKEIDSIAQRLEDYFYHFKDYTMFDFDLSDEDRKNSIEQRKSDLTDIEAIDKIIFNVNDCNKNFDSSHQSEADALIKLLQEQRAFLVTRQDKRMVGDTDYEVKHAIHVGDKEILFAVDMNADKGLYYLVCNATRNELFEQFADGSGSGDYLEMMKEFIDRVGVQIETVRSEQEQINLPDTIFTAEHCFPNDYKQSIDGKVVAIRADIFRPEYRRGDNQLVLVAKGFGANANARGNAVFCYHLNNGKHTRFERHDVQGEVKPECMPDWAKKGLAAVKAQIAAEHAKSKKDRGDAR